MKKQKKEKEKICEHNVFKKKSGIFKETWKCNNCGKEIKCWWFQIPDKDK